MRGKTSKMDPSHSVLQVSCYLSKILMHLSLQKLLVSKEWSSETKNRNGRPLQNSIRGVKRIRAHMEQQAAPSWPNQQESQFQTGNTASVLSNLWICSLG